MRHSKTFRTQVLNISRSQGNDVRVVTSSQQLARPRRKPWLDFDNALSKMHFPFPGSAMRAVLFVALLFVCGFPAPVSRCVAGPVSGFPPLSDPQSIALPPSYDHVLGPRIKKLQVQVSTSATDHCHWQSCVVNRGRSQLPNDLCGDERSADERVACLEQRRGQPYDASTPDDSPPPWPLQQIPESFKDFVFIKNMKTGGSTLKTIIDKWVVHSNLAHAPQSERDYVTKEIPMDRVVVRSYNNKRTGDSFWFSTCRHPLARTISHFHHCLRSTHGFTRQGRKPPVTSCGALALNGGFEKFVEESELVHDYQWSFIQNNLVTPQQVDFCWNL